MPAGQPSLTWRLLLEPGCYLRLEKVQSGSLDVQTTHIGMKIFTGLLARELFLVILPMKDQVSELMTDCFIPMVNLLLTGTIRWVRLIMQEIWLSVQALLQGSSITGRHIIL